MSTKEDLKKLADYIFPNAKDWKEFVEKYPKRNLKEGAEVTRFAPSPTGFIHIGGLYTAIITEKIANETDGVFILRIEDTDQKREVKDGIEGIINSLNDFDIHPDEGAVCIKDGEIVEKGNYGTYIQSKRKDIYQAFAKKLLEEGLAYPCFMTEEEMNEVRTLQAANKEPIGIYGRWAKYRNIEPDEAIKLIEEGFEPVIRLKSPGQMDKKIVHNDLIKGKVEFPENILDIVIIKKDGLPTYHFAHAIDDHFMDVTMITRSDEWLPSVPLHLQLFDVLGFERLKYAHIAPLLKLDNGNRRKLSKRKDPESAASYYKEEGIPVNAVKEYLYNIINPSFEMWRKENENIPLSEFEIDITKMNVSGALFDMTKLLNVSKDIVARLNKDEVYNYVLNWAKEYDLELFNLLNDNKEYSLEILNIERENGRRKDIAKWSDVKDSIWYMYKEEFDKNILDISNYEFKEELSKDKKSEIENIVKTYVDKYLDFDDDKKEWFDKIKELSFEFGYAKEIKEFKKNKEAYKGHVGDVSGYIRVVLTSKSQTPDLYEIIKVLKKEEVIRRINKFVNL